MTFRWLRHPRTKTAHAFADGAEFSLCLNLARTEGLSVVLRINECNICRKSINRRKPAPAVMRDRIKRRKERIDK